MEAGILLERGSQEYALRPPSPTPTPTPTPTTPFPPFPTLAPDAATLETVNVHKLSKL